MYLPWSIGELAGIGPTPNSVAVGPGTPFAAVDPHAAFDSADDREEAEFQALYAAAGFSLEAIARDAGHAPALRAVLTVEAEEAPNSGAVAGDLFIGVISSPLECTAVCAHVDEPQAAGLVRSAAIAGDDGAGALEGADLLWYDVSELGDIPLAP